MKPCELCGKELKLFERYFKMIGDRQCRLCRDCAENSEGLLSSSSIKKIRAVSWGRVILKNGIADKETESILKKRLADAENSIK